ncbi:type II toxin-antitoxin system PemK/MazF family toxin [Chloroflexus sp.]|uniref:type II toxin-antitoxin system PemK/MazF family toxin n=1 Tax=Chloroflexus sp. TaxID=1904827 RepID=UPI002ACE7AE8|nr:type II toxin-antitoxin system PemK/MazF family toxin [Chloroflexus sp.]
MQVKRFDVFLVQLDPTLGTEIQKTRPCLIISPDEINDFLQTVIVAPMTTRLRSYPTRLTCRFQDRDASIALDQIRTIDKSRLVSYLGQIDRSTQKQVLAVLAELFSE